MILLCFYTFYEQRELLPFFPDYLFQGVCTAAALEDRVCLSRAEDSFTYCFGRCSVSLQSLTASTTNLTPPLGQNIGILLPVKEGLDSLSSEFL